MEIRKSTVLAVSKLSKKEKKFYSQKICKFCGEEIGLNKKMYHINQEAFHDECELDHLLTQSEKKKFVDKNYDSLADGDLVMIEDDIEKLKFFQGELHVEGDKSLFHYSNWYRKISEDGKTVVMKQFERINK